MPDLAKTTATATQISDYANAQEGALRRQCVEWALMYRGNDTTSTIMQFADDLLAYIREGKS